MSNKENKPMKEDTTIYPLLSELIRQHIATTKDEVPALTEFMHYAQHMEQQMGFGRLASDINRSIINKQTRLIQRLVDGWYAADGGRDMHAAIAAAEDAGFKPSQP
jgi:predicted metal-dependent hydrolase